MLDLNRRLRGGKRGRRGVGDVQNKDYRGIQIHSLERGSSATAFTPS